ncbi:MAG: hypothetical protein U0N82_02780 [Oscillospiraceae bacterium]
MCRRNYLHGCCLVAFGLGLLMGHCLESWLLCCCGGIGLMILGFCVMGKK